MTKFKLHRGLTVIYPSDKTCLEILFQEQSYSRLQLG